jgi:hypothetical protein
VNNLIKHINKIFVLLVTALFLHMPVVEAQKYIYFDPSDSLDIELFAPKGYISVEVIINDSVQHLGDHLGFTDSVSSFEVILDSMFSLIANHEDLIFTYRNTLNNCYSERIYYQVDTVLSNDNNLYLRNFGFDLYSIYNNQLEVCGNDTLSALPTNIPSAGYSSVSENILDIDSFGYFNPSTSIPGFYVITVESEHCFNTVSDSILITILDSTPLDVPDTLFYCSDSDNSSMPFTGYSIVGINVSDTGQPILSEITSGYYEVVGSEGTSSQCVETATTWIEVIQTQDLPLITSEELCDKVVIGLEISDEVQSIEWSDGTSGNTIEVTQSSSLSVQIVDKYGCRSSDSIDVEFYPLRIDTFLYHVADADCWTEGTIQLDRIDVNKSIREDQQKLVNTLNGEYVNDLESVSEGIYKLEVTDSKNCTELSDEEIVVKQKCIEEYPVFSPNQDGLEDEYFIPHEGSIKIFDRNGILLNEFYTPAYWDGTDFSGNQLPMGNYIIITDDNKPVNITLIK